MLLFVEPGVGVQVVHHRGVGVPFAVAIGGAGDQVAGDRGGQHLQQHGQGTLTLCGERSAQRFEARPRSLGSKISSLFGRVRPSTVLEKL